jgi:cold shock CspA family protein
LGYGPVGGAYFEAGEAADADVFAEFRDLRGDELRDGDSVEGETCTGGTGTSISPCLKRS